MNYILKTLNNFKSAPCLYPLASVRDLSPPTSDGKRSRNGGIGRGRKLFRYDDVNYYIYLRRKQQNKNTEGKKSSNSKSMEFDFDLNCFASTGSNEIYPLYFRPELTRAMKLRASFRTNNNVIELNHNNNFNQEEVCYDERK